MSRVYYTVCAREDNVWGPQFGDYSRKVVEAEADDMRSQYRRKDLHIIKSGDRQVDINAAVAQLNAEGNAK